MLCDASPPKVLDEFGVFRVQSDIPDERMWTPKWQQPKKTKMKPHIWRNSGLTYDTRNIIFGLAGVI
jgi:hypothetical protein